MHEADRDLGWRQDLRARTAATARSHLRVIPTPAARFDAAKVVESRGGSNISVAATVSSDGRVFTGPVDTGPSSQPSGELHPQPVGPVDHDTLRPDGDRDLT